MSRQNNYFPIILVLPFITGVAFAAGAVQEVTGITTCRLEGDCFGFLGFTARIQYYCSKFGW